MCLGFFPQIFKNIKIINFFSFFRKLQNVYIQ
jgi:hypothetical protein